MREQINELVNLFRSKDNLIYALTYEENEFISEVCNAIRRVNSSNSGFKIPGNIYVYSKPRGMYKLDLMNPFVFDPEKVEKGIVNHMQALQFIENMQLNTTKRQDNLMSQIRGESKKDNDDKDEFSTPTIFILKDLHLYFNDKDFIRKLRDLKEIYGDGKVYCPIIITAPVMEFPPELEKIFTLFEFSLLTKKEINDLFINDSLLSNLYHDKDKIEDMANKLSTASVGLTYREIGRAISHSLIKHNKTDIDPKDIYEEKLQIVKKSGALDFVSPEHDISDLGGCYAFKEWMKHVKEAISPEAKEFGIPQPKGAMLVGVPGTSKSVSAEILASYLGVPLLNLDMAKVMGSFVGQSERQIANALRIAQAVSPCVLLLDECEKVLGGIQSSNSTDSGTLARVMSQLLNFLQKDNTGVITIMTSNDVSQLPPELTRTGRIDAQWMFDLPNAEEREEILEIYLKKYNLSADDSTKDYIVDNTDTFTGAEIKSAVKDMLVNSFYRQKQDNIKEYSREIRESDAELAISNTVTVYKSSKEKIEKFRSYASNRYLNASRMITSVKAPQKKKPAAFTFMMNKKE